MHKNTGVRYAPEYDKINYMKHSQDNLKVKGIFRINITEKDKNGNEKIVGDSGWTKNQVTNLGIRDYLTDALLGNSPLGAISHMALGTGGAPASDATALTGEITHASNSRKAVSTSLVASGTAQFTGAFNSADSVVTASVNISNIGLFNTSTTEGGVLFAGNTFASSALATNQSVNATYQIRFASA